MRNVGKRSAAGFGLVGLVVLGLATYACRGWIAETYYLWRFDSSSDEAERETLATKLAEVGGHRAAVRMAEVFLEEEGQPGLQATITSSIGPGSIALKASYLSPGGYVTSGPFVEWAGEGLTFADPSIEPHYSALALARLGRPGARQLDRFLRAAFPRAAAPSDVQVVALRMLRRLGKAAALTAPTLLVALRDDDPAVRYAAYLAWLKIGAPRSEILHEHLRHRDREVRRLATLALSHATPFLAADLAALERALDDSDRGVRRGAVTALFFTRRKHEGVVDALREALASNDRVVRAQATEGLGWIVGDFSGAVPLLLERVKDPAPEVRLAAVTALGYSGGNSSTVVAALRQFDDAGAEVQAAAKLALTRLERTSQRQTRAQPTP